MRRRSFHLLIPRRPVFTRANAPDSSLAGSSALPSRCLGRSRRGAGIAAIVLMLAVLNILVIGAVAPGADDGNVEGLRLDSIRAFYAAESGGIIIARCAGLNIAAPAAGSSIAIGNASVQFVQVPATGASGQAEVVGSCGRASKRVRITLE